MKKKPVLTMTLPSSKKAGDFYNRSVSKVIITSPQWKLRGEGVFFIGSCFAEYLFRYFDEADLNAMSAPFGNIYNPESLAEAAAMLAGNTGLTASDCFKSASIDSKFRHYMFHSLINASDAESLVRDLNKRITEARNFISRAESAVITLGTSLVYRLKSGQTVSNCHKLPAANFDRVQLDLTEAAKALERTVNSLREINPDLKIIISLSPVRHLRDNASENSLSKAILRCAIDKVCNSTDTYYFPSFEIMIDELRDYRWYAEDLCHPSDTAVSFIISRFIESVYDESFHDFIENYSAVLKDLRHKPFNPESNEYLSFRAKAEERKAKLKLQHPHLFR